MPPSSSKRALSGMRFYENYGSCASNHSMMETPANVLCQTFGIVAFNLRKTVLETQLQAFFFFFWKEEVLQYFARSPCAAWRLSMKFCAMIHYGTGCEATTRLPVCLPAHPLLFLYQLSMKTWTFSYFHNSLRYSVHTPAAPVAVY